jgi:hypothetical protein
MSYGVRYRQNAEPTWRNGWVVTSDLGDVCMALNEFVARETAIALAQYRKVHP